MQTNSLLFCYRLNIHALATTVPFLFLSTFPSQKTVTSEFRHSTVLSIVCVLLSSQITLLNITYNLFYFSFVTL